MTIQARPEGRPAAEVLAWSRETVDPALRAAVASLPASMRRIADYHFGWRDAQDRPAHNAGGKAIRPALALLAAEVSGGDPAAAVPAAVAVELVHNFSLLHDDVMDGDETRRHRPTAWTVFGRGAAILAGDALLSLASDILARSEHRCSAEATRILGAAVLALIEGQAADLAFEERQDVGMAECVAMAEGKTAALLSASCRLGAVYGDAGRAQAERLGEFGRLLGLAFQYVDDMLDLWGDSAAMGKPAQRDLRTRKKTLPIVAALTSDTPAGRELRRLYRADGHLDSAAAAALLDEAGAREWSTARTDELMRRAMGLLDGAGGTRAVRELCAVARFVVRRDR